MQKLLNWCHVNDIVINTEKTIAMSFDTWLNRCVLKPQIIFKGLAIKYQHEQNFWVYI